MNGRKRVRVDVKRGVGRSTHDGPGNGMQLGDKYATTFTLVERRAHQQSTLEMDITKSILAGQGSEREVKPLIPNTHRPRRNAVLHTTISVHSDRATSSNAEAPKAMVAEEVSGMVSVKTMAQTR